MNLVKWKPLCGAKGLKFEQIFTRNHLNLGISSTPILEFLLIYGKKFLLEKDNEFNQSRFYNYSPGKLDRKKAALANTHKLEIILIDVRHSK